MLCWNSKAPLLALLAVLELATLRAGAQSGDDSPYSSYGLGDLVGEPQVSQALMGGVGVGLIEPYSVIRVNPASYAGLLRTTFELGGVAHFINLSTDELVEDRSNARFQGLTFGVPFGQGRWGVALGLQPVTEVGYKVIDRTTIDTGEEVRFEYSGTGGMNRAFIGAGTALWQRKDTLGLDNGSRLTFGANFNYLFGSIDQYRKAYYPDNAGYSNTSVFTALVLHDPAFDAGLQWQGDLRRRRTKEDEGLKYCIGVSAEWAPELSAERTSLVTSFIVSSEVEYTRDTIAFDDQVPGTLSLPAALGLGASVFDAHWTVSAEVRQRDWSTLRLNVPGFELPASLGTSLAVAIGLAWRPVGDRTGGSFLERTIWRGGLRYADDYLLVNNVQMDQMALALGAGFPLLGSMSRSRLNLGVELGQRGTQDNGLIQERFVNAFVGFTFTPTFNEPWFKKRRIE